MPRYSISDPPEFPAHPYITREGLRNPEIMQEIRDHATTPIDTRFRTFRGPDYRIEDEDDIITGSIKEDFPGRNPFCFLRRECVRKGPLNHFGNPDVPVAGQFFVNNIVEDGAFNEGIHIRLFGRDRPNPSAYRLAEYYWANYILPLILAEKDGLGPDRLAEAYFWFGRVLHLIEDMTVPAHVHLAPHGIRGSEDMYETLFARWRRWRKIKFRLP